MLKFKSRSGLKVAVLLLMILCTVLGVSTGLHAEGMGGDPPVSAPVPPPEPAPTTSGNYLLDLLILVLAVA